MTGKQNVALKFDLPFCIHLQNATYEVGLGKRVVWIRTEKVWRNSKGCSDDDSVGEEKLHFQEGSYEMGPMGQDFDQAKTFIGTNMERIDDPHGRLRFTRIAAWLQHPNADNEKAENLLTEALEAVNRLIDVYRYASDRAYLPPLGVADVEYAEVFIPDSGRLLYPTFFGKGLTNAVINESQGVHARVKEMLKTQEEVPLYAELRLAARRLLGEDLWRQAVVEAVSALDAFLGQALRRGLVETNRMTEDEFESLMNKPLTDRLKGPLREAVGCSPVDRPSLWRDWIQSNETRRKVVHQGRKATEKEATKVVETIDRLVAYVDENLTM